MSGGSLDYFYYRLEDHVGDFDDAELDDLVKDLAELFHDREWYLSGDTGIGEWRESRDKFKEKWFTKHGREERIEKYLADIRTEVRETFGFNQERCHNCKHWTEEDVDKYGQCKFNEYCLMHRYVNCDKFEGRIDADK